MLEVNEIFGPTIQGEGKLVGNPSIFIRFGKCNFRCEGFQVEYETPSGVKKCSCDSFYAVDPEFKNSWHKMNSIDIIKKVQELEPSYKCDIVITGGEPLLYWQNEEFQKLIKYYIENNYTLTIETNASLNLNFNEEYQKKIIFSMSVKLSNSLEPLKKRVNKETLRKIIKNTSFSYLKFVINKDFLEKAKEEIDYISSIIPSCEIYLMPMGDSSKELDLHSESVINMAIKYGFKYCDRLHIRVWDNQRGV